MSPNRQGRDPEDALLVRSLGLRLADGERLDAHAHPWGQLVYATRGVMSVGTPGGTWVVPPQRAAWVPGDCEHTLATTGRVHLRTLYLRPDLAAPLPATCRVLEVTTLLRELVLEIQRRGMLRDDDPPAARLAQVLVDQIRVTPDVALELPWPRDPRALRLARLVAERPARTEPLGELCLGSGAGARTLERVFVRETGLSFGRWRQRARLLHALRRLAAGESVTSTALEVGFSSTSAFIAMFRRALGRTPGRYFGAPLVEAGG